MAVLLIRGVTLPGAAEGIKFYLIPDWDKLCSAQVRSLHIPLDSVAFLNDWLLLTPLLLGIFFFVKNYFFGQ